MKLGGMEVVGFDLQDEYLRSIKKTTIRILYARKFVMKKEQLRPDWIRERLASMAFVLQHQTPDRLRLNKEELVGILSV